MPVSIESLTSDVLSDIFSHKKHQEPIEAAAASPAPAHTTYRNLSTKVYYHTPRGETYTQVDRNPGPQQFTINTLPGNQIQVVTQAGQTIIENAANLRRALPFAIESIFQKQEQESEGVIGTLTVLTKEGWEEFDQVSDPKTALKPKQYRIICTPGASTNTLEFLGPDNQPVRKELKTSNSRGLSSEIERYIHDSHKEIPRSQAALASGDIDISKLPDSLPIGADYSSQTYTRKESGAKLGKEEYSIKKTGPNTLTVTTSDGETTLTAAPHKDPIGLIIKSIQELRSSRFNLTTISFKSRNCGNVTLQQIQPHEKLRPGTFRLTDSRTYTGGKQLEFFGRPFPDQRSGYPQRQDIAAYRLNGTKEEIRESITDRVKMLYG